MKKLILLLTVFIIINCNYSESFIKDIKLPPGFEIEIMSKNVKGARSLTLSKSGTIYVSTRIGNIYALKDYNNDNKIDKRYVIADNLNTPNGIDFHNIICSSTQIFLERDGFEMDARCIRKEFRPSSPNRPTVI